MWAVSKPGPRALEGVLVVIIVTLLGPAQSPAASRNESTRTMKNLNAALSAERNDHARYLAFAQKADQEGYGAVASLFRAIAAAEEIHQSNHEQTIQRLGGTAALNLETIEIRSTRENLQASLDAESYEWGTMYPQFIAQAREDWYVPAAASFEKAQRTEEQHVEMLKAVFRNLDSLKGSLARTYYVCTICGFTTADLNFDKCRGCVNPKSKYKVVS
ncbi:MAG: rubrerythrin family protein [Candidatus Acidiferrum sp.]